MEAEVPTVVAAPIIDLEKHYIGVMRENKAPLFETFETYVASLPVRRSMEAEMYVKLADVPFFARKEDLMMMISRLEGKEGSADARSLVRYGCGKSGSGKTSSICPAFLNSAQSQSPGKFSHYLYLAFANNGGNNFLASGLEKISTDENVATAQGAAFMVRCLEKLLTNSQDKSIVIQCQDEVQHENVETFASACSALLDRNIEIGRILVHVDETRKMANDEGDKAKHHYIYFRRGAMSMLALVPRVVVIATFVEIPLEIPADTSCDTCRRAVPIPMLDIEAAMLAAGVVLDNVELKQDTARMVASLKFCLAALLSTQMSVFHQAYTFFKEDGNEPSRDVTQIRNVFQKVLQYIETPTKGNLQEVSKLIKDPFRSKTRKKDQCVVEMLLGMSEDEIDNIDRKVGGQIIAISAKKSSAKMFYLLTDLLTRGPYPKTDAIKVWSQCRNLFLDALSMNVDIFSGTPLERAVLWSLAIMSNSLGYVELDGRDHVFTCKSVEKARIFPGSSIVFDDHVHRNISELKVNTLYYADEHYEGREDGVTSHPVGDVFFLTEEKKLVLIDTTAKAYKQMTTKRKHMQRFAELWDGEKVHNLPCKDLILFIFNPLESKKSGTSTTCSKLHYLFREDTLDLLRGFAQCMA